MPSEFKIKNGLIVDRGGAQVTGSVIATQTGFNASGIFTGDTIGAVVVSTTASLGFSILTSGGTFSVYDNTNAATRFYMSSGGDIGIGTSSPGAKLNVKGTVKIEDQTGTPAAPATPGSPTEGYGIDGTKYLGEPSVWLKINVDGSDYYFPGYE